MSMRSIEIYWQDLTPEKQAEIMEVLGDTGNYDVFPIATVDYEEDEDMAGEAESDGEQESEMRICKQRFEIAVQGYNLFNLLSNGLNRL